MDTLQWSARPDLRSPVMLAAFEGWTDAGGSASGAATYLADKWGAAPFADIDAEDFYDFTVSRPQVRLRGDRSREIVWPANRFLSASVAANHDVVLLTGVEPHLRWRSYCACVADVAREVGVEAVFTVGAMLADVAHTRPVPVRGSSADPVLCERLGLQRPQYQGPTGIVGVLQDALGSAGIPVGSFMAQVPHYIPNTPSPKATLAIVERLAGVLGARVPTTDLQIAAAAYERQVSEVVAADEDMATYVHQLEERVDEGETAGDLGELPSGDALAAELERFLREQGGPS